MIGKLPARGACKLTSKVLTPNRFSPANALGETFSKSEPLRSGKRSSRAKSATQVADCTHSAMTYSHNDQWFDQQHQRPTT
jgi:hypothetical protein